jgi:hypothetical protein
MDLADAAHGLEMAGEIWPAHDRAHSEPAPSQCPDRMPSDEARAADDRNEPPFFPCHHARIPIA